MRENVFKGVESILPGYIDNSDFRFLNIDDKVVASLIIKDFPKKSEALDVISTLLIDFNYDLSIKVMKQDTKKVLKDITYHLASSMGEIKTINSNQIDIDLIDNIKADAQNLRHEIQINNEEIFLVEATITFYNRNDNKYNFMGLLKKIESGYYSKNIRTSYANFRQLDSYFSSIPSPFNYADGAFKKNVFTTSSLSSLFCFFNNDIFDPKGIIWGKLAGSGNLCVIDLFDEKYFNSNVCIFGSSGSGKSYFAKLSIIRHRFVNKFQYVFDPEGEYTKIAEKLRGTVIRLTDNDKSHKLNIMDITEEDILEDREFFLANKIEAINKTIRTLTELEDKYTEIIKEALLKTYRSKGITDDVETVYKEHDSKTVYVDKNKREFKDMPTLTDFINELNSINNKKQKLSRGGDLKEVIILIKKKIVNKLFFFNGHTTFTLNNRLTVFDLSNLDVEKQVLFIKIVLEKIEKRLRFCNRNKTIIYIDEVWKYISSYSDFGLSKIVFSMYKTIRKQGGSIITITQDISDYLTYENGDFGKGIMNNSAFKMFFKMNYNDIDLFFKSGFIDNEMAEKINYLYKGNAILKFNNSTTKIVVKASSVEEKLISIKGD